MNRVNPSLGTMNCSSRNNQPKLSPERPEGHGWPPSLPAPPTYRNLLDWDCTIVLIPCFLFGEGWGPATIEVPWEVPWRLGV